MSKKVTNRWKESALSVSAVVLLFASLWLCKPDVFGRGNQDGGLLGVFDLAAAGRKQYFYDCGAAEGGFSDELEEEEECELEYPIILSMPICADLRESISALQIARADLLKAILDGDERTELIAIKGYHEALMDVEDGFAILKMRVVPDSFSGVAQELIYVCNTDRGHTVFPFELGHLERDVWQ